MYCLCDTISVTCWLALLNFNAERRWWRSISSSRDPLFIRRCSALSIDYIAFIGLPVLNSSSILRGEISMSP